MERTAQETQGLYWFGPPLWCNTLLQCVVWWIASWADDDEQCKEEQPREGLFLAGVMNCWEELSHLSLSLSLSDLLSLSLPCLPLLLCGWLVLFIEALVLFPNIEREGSQQWRANLKGATSINYPDKSSLRLRKALVMTPSWAPR